MSSAHFLTKNRHGSRYFFRGVLPTDLRPYFDERREFRIALGTSDRREARYKALTIWLLLQTEFAHIREKVVADPDIIKSFQIKLLIEKTKRSILAGEITTLRQEKDWAEAGERAERKRAQKAHADAIAALAANRHPTTSPSPVTSISFTEVAREHLAKYARHGGRGKPPAASTLTKKKEKVAFWQGYLGDRPINEIDGGEIGAIEEWIYELPANSNKLYDHPSEAVKAAIEGHIHKTICSGKTAVDYLRTLGAIFKLAKQRGYISHNPAEQLLDVKQHREDATHKRPFTNEELLKIFPDSYGADFQLQGIRDPEQMSARFWVPLLSLFSGARLEELCQLRVDDIAEASSVHYYRLTSDGEAHDGAAKRLKNQNSNRLVPIHPRLIEVGFLDFVAEREKKGGKTAGLFELQRNKGGRLGKNLSSWFSRHERRSKSDGSAYYVGGYIQRRGVVSKGMEGGKAWALSFHTFRHTVINRLLMTKHPTTGEEFTESQIDQLTGHAKTKSGVNLYTDDGKKLRQLSAAAITAAMAVDFDFLPLDQIRWEGFRTSYL